MAANSAGLMFGIYPFGAAGTGAGVATGPPDDFTRLPQIIEHLCGGRQFLLRTYVPYTGDEASALLQIEFVARSRLPWEIALCFRQPGDDLAGWLALTGEIVARYGNTIDSLQVTNEPNLKHVPHSADGSHPAVLPALAQGVLAAKRAKQATGATLAIGFNAVPAFHGSDNFWPAVQQFGSAFVNALDYVGIDFYPDVFGSPIALEHLPDAVECILYDFRERDMASAGIPRSVPLRICENGWPTGSHRPPDRQAPVLETIIRKVHSLREILNITHYELFGLRDADSSNDNMFYQFGILRDDYTPKPAFEVYRRLIQSLSC
jgi:hypothetical protein